MVQLHPIPAVRAIIANEHQQILILQRDNTNFGQGAWCLPGGKVDYGQTVEEALALELTEELSVRLVSAEFLFFQNSLPVGQGEPHYINFYFRCRIAGEIRLNEESSDLAWVGQAELLEYQVVFRNDEAISRYFIKLRP